MSVAGLRRRAGGEQLRVIKGGGRTNSVKTGWRRYPVYYLLMVVALFLVAQVLLGWIWGSFNRRAGEVVFATEGSVDVSFTAKGILTFDEELVFAPQSGFVHYYVDGGERVPVGKKIAVITTFPKDLPAPSAEEDQNMEEYLQRFRQWLLDDPGAADSFAVDLLSPHNRETVIKSTRAGKISFMLDGWETFGPNSSFVYLDDEEYNEKKPETQLFSSGEQITRFSPVLRIIDNYRWYFSAVLPQEPGRLIAESDSIELLFSFADGKPVRGEKIEQEVRSGGDLEITWRINQAAGDFYNQRWCTAEIVYDRMEGVFIPDNTVLEQNGAEGVYVVDKSVVAFKEITIIDEKEDMLLVEGLNSYDRVITRPGRVKEGQRFLF